MNEYKTCTRNRTRDKRDAVSRQIGHEESERDRLKGGVEELTKRLTKADESLARKHATKIKFDTTIEQTEAAYRKIMESSQTLLHVLQREAKNLEKKQTG